MSQLLKLSRVNFPTLRHFVNCLLNYWQLDIEQREVTQEHSIQFHVDQPDSWKAGVTFV